MPYKKTKKLKINMLHLTINKKKYSIPNEWSEMTLEYYCGIFEILKKYQRNEEQEKEDEGKDLLKYFFVQETKMYRELFIYMTDVDEQTIDKVPISDIEAVMQCLDTVTKDYVPTGMTYFELDNDIYYFPMDFLRTGTFGEYIEASQLEMNTQYLKNGRFDILPEQMAILPISEKFHDYAQEVRSKLNAADISGEVDERAEKIGRKIRDAEMKKIPFMIIIGEKEVESNTISIRKKGDGDVGSITVEEFENQFNNTVKEEING